VFAQRYQRDRRHRSLGDIGVEQMGDKMPNRQPLGWRGLGAYGEWSSGKNFSFASLIWMLSIPWTNCLSMGLFRTLFA
jgi:hypothetical protein